MPVPTPGGAVRGRGVEPTVAAIPPEGAARVLLYLASRECTGLWELYASGRIHRMALRAGRPIHVLPGDPPWRLGDVLRRQGVLHSESGEAAEQRLAPGSGRAGDRLVAAGLVERDDVERALREQVRLRAAQVLAPTAGRWRFWPGATHLRNLPRQPSRWDAGELIAALPRIHGVSRDSRRDPTPNADLWETLRRVEDPADAHAALGIEPGADPRRVRAAFREIAKRHHPDRVASSENPTRRLLHRRIFEAAVRAYERAGVASR
jgi:hypothetical protein